MAQRTKTQLAADILAYIKDNGGADNTKTKGAEHRILNQNIVDSLLAYEEETAQATIEAPASVEANKFVSVRRFWQGLTKQMSLAWTWLEKQTFGKGINLGNNASPSANGDFWSDASDLFTRLGGVNYRIPTTRNKHGRVLYVSKDGNDSTAVIGSQNFTFLTVQAAINASTSGDTIIVFNGTYSETVVVPLRKYLKIILIDTTVSSISIMEDVGNPTYITGLGKSKINSLGCNHGSWSDRIILKDIIIDNISSTGGNGVFCELFNVEVTTLFSCSYAKVTDCNFKCPFSSKYIVDSVINTQFNCNVFTSLYGFSSGRFINCTFNFTNTSNNSVLGLYTTGDKPIFINCTIKAIGQIVFPLHPFSPSSQKMYFNNCIFECDTVVSANSSSVEIFFKKCILIGTNWTTTATANLSLCEIDVNFKC